ncbi:hypothetical protein MLD38_003697 [Melastoma candidum]|uniref:Uncharacterized protein n=1 Tax=Melastoma candidum TaxID=119954 RepID=A0ACB9S4Z0_9MYRT|nr:hypothetical protein MLD38_003697 [Melastoma candidum]
MKDSAELTRETPKKSWTKKIKLIKQSSLGSKLKASRAYLKSLFSKSGCSDDSCLHDSKNKQNSDSCEKKKKKKKTPFGQIQTYRNRSAISGERVRENEKTTDVGTNSHRRSFSLSVKWHLSNKVSSSSTSLKPPSSPLVKRPSEFNGIRFLKRSSNVKSEMESPIPGAIAHCKRSQQQVRLRVMEG